MRSHHLCLNPHLVSQMSPGPERQLPTLPFTMSTPTFAKGHGQLIYMRGCAGILPYRVYHHIHLCPFLTIYSDLCLSGTNSQDSSQVVITGPSSNVYVKANTIPLAEQQKVAPFSLPGVLFIIHHNWVKKWITCTSFLLPRLRFLPSNGGLVPALEPEFTPRAARHVFGTTALSRTLP